MISLILIGGRSRRMGRDKWSIERPDGQRQIEHLVGLALTGGDEVVLSLRPGETPPLPLPFVHDPVEDGGPLASLAAVHAGRPGQPVRLLGCDLFLLDAGTLAELSEKRDRGAGATCFANRLNGRPEPLAAIYEASPVTAAAAAVAAGERRARNFLESLSPRVLPLTRPEALDNANTPEELAECFAKLRSGVGAKRVHVGYPASRAITERLTTLACTVGGLYAELSFVHRLPGFPAMSASRNGKPCAWAAPIEEGDEIGFREAGR